MKQNFKNKKACPPSRLVGSRRGITVIEMLVIIVVIGIISLIVLPQFSKIKENQVLKDGVADVLSSLDKARSQTLSSLNSSEYGVHFQSDKVIIFKGKDFSTRETAKDETINIVTPAVMSSGTLTLPANIFFNRLSGMPSTNGTVIISTSSYSKIITISATGGASVN